MNVAAMFNRPILGLQWAGKHQESLKSRKDLEIVNGAITLAPSVGNWSLPCKSHYLIRQGRVVWARDMTRDEIERGRLRDKRLRDAHFDQVNAQKEAEMERMATAARCSAGWLARLWRALRSWISPVD